MKLSVERKIAAGFGAGLLLLSLISALSAWSALRFVQTAQQANHAQKVLDTLGTLSSRMKDAETGQRGYLLTSKDAYLQPYYSAIDLLDRYTDELQYLLRYEPDQLKRLAKFKTLTAFKTAELRQTIALRRNEGLNAALTVVNEDKGKHWMDDIQKLILTMQTDENKRLDELTQTTIANAQRLVLIVITGSVLAIALAPSALLVINGDITKRKRAETLLQQSESALQLANQHLTSQIEELEERNHTAALFSEMSDLFQACLTVEEACTVVAQVLPQFFPGLVGGISLTNASRNLVEACVTWGGLCHSQVLFAPDECLSLRRGQPYLSVLHPKNLRCDHFQSAPSGESFCIPMLAQGETIGVLYLEAAQPDQLTEENQNQAIAIAKQVSMALANLTLRQTLQAQSIRDPLTGLYNRRYLEEFLLRELHRAERNQQRIGIIMIDVDHFKRFNDDFGHEAGDSVLRELGVFLRTNIRKSDIACRYGGEELTLILPEATLEGARERAEKLREGVKRLKVQYQRQTLDTITISLGVACFPTHGSTGDAIIQAADVALYRAKADGRDRVVVADAMTEARVD